MAKPLIVGNWKMHKTVGEAVSFARRLRETLAANIERSVVVAPPFTAIYSVAQVLNGSGIGICAQNVHEKAAGAYTGEISAPMLAESGCEYVIVGHSERRTYFHEGDDVVNGKMLSVLQSGLRPICCVGETLAEREEGQTFSVIERQLNGCLRGLDPAQRGRTVVAYEPVWAIGTGKTATPAEAEAVHRFIRGLIEKGHGGGVPAGLQVIYGGSVTPANMADLMARPEIDGVLVGGASLEMESFVKIVHY